MEVYEVKFWEFWSYDEEAGTLNSLTISAEDAEQAIKKVKKLAMQGDREKFVEEPDDYNDLKESVTHTLDSITIHEVVHISSLDG